MQQREVCNNLAQKEECAGDMGLRRNYAVAKDAQTKPSVVECAEGTGHFTIGKKNLLFDSTTETRSLLSSAVVPGKLTT